MTTNRRSPQRLSVDHVPEDCPCPCHAMYSARTARRRNRAIIRAQVLIVSGGMVPGGLGVHAVLGGGDGLQLFSASAFLFGAAAALNLLRSRDDE